MMELLIKGDERKIRRLAKEIRLRLKRDGLEASFKEAKKAPSVSEAPKKASAKAKPKNSKW